MGSIRHTLWLLGLVVCTAGCSNTWENVDQPTQSVLAEDVAAVLDGRTQWKGVLPAPKDEKDIVEGRWHLVSEIPFTQVPGGSSRKPVLVDPQAIAAPETPAVAAAPVILQQPPRKKARTLPVPKKRVTPVAVAKPSSSPEERARAHFLDNPTIVRAARVTFYCPAAYLPELSLKAEDVRETSATRRVATGGAKLVCRQLTLLAERITLRIREGVDAQLQVTARGDVDFISRLSKQAVHEEGLKSLILRQERMIPLR